MPICSASKASPCWTPGPVTTTALSPAPGWPRSESSWMTRSCGDRGVLAERVSTVLAYQQQAAGYDAEAGGGLFAADEPVVAEYLSGREPGVALDDACGTGRFAEFLSRRGHRVIGVDSSPDMLACARRRVPDGEFRVGDLHRLPLPGESVDVIVCALALVHVPRLEPVPAAGPEPRLPGTAVRGTARHPVGQPAARTRDRHRRLAGLALVAAGLPAIGGAGRRQPPGTSHLALPATRERPPAIENVHLGSAVAGVGPADRAGKSR